MSLEHVWIARVICWQANATHTEMRQRWSSNLGAFRDAATAIKYAHDAMEKEQRINPDYHRRPTSEGGCDNESHYTHTVDFYDWDVTPPVESDWHEPTLCNENKWRTLEIDVSRWEVK